MEAKINSAFDISNNSIYVNIIRGNFNKLFGDEEGLKIIFLGRAQFDRVLLLFLCIIKQYQNSF
jgi:hypothetical protein